MFAKRILSTHVQTLNQGNVFNRQGDIMLRDHNGVAALVL